MEKTKIDNEFFEWVIIYNALVSETYLTSIIDVVQPCFFKDDNIRIIFDVITSFYKKRNALPTTTELKTYLVTNEQKKALKEVINNFKQLDKVYNQDELYANTEQFFKEKAVYHAVLNVANKYSTDSSSFNTSEILQQFEQACNISLVEDLGKDYLGEINEHCNDLQKVQDFISTGYKWLDKKLGGGFLATGRAMYTFSGVTNSGKSIILGNLATNILAQDKNVVVISLEMPEFIYSQRISSQLSRIPLRGLKEKTDELKKFVGNYRIQYPNAKLYIKEFPPKAVTANHIRAYIEKLVSKKKFTPHAIIIDYVNLIKPAIETGNLYSDIKACSEQLRALSYVFKCPCITATQLNRTAFGESNPGLESTSESLGLAMTTDFQAAIWSEDSDKELGIIHMCVQKNRFGENYGNTAFKIDYDTLAIDETEDTFTNTTEVINTENSLEKLLK